MNQTIYQQLERYMLSCMGDSAHDAEHIYRVLYTALEIASAEVLADHDILIAACLLHDVGRPEQLADPSLCHAEVGAGKAYRFLLDAGFEESFAAHVRDCILTHRYRKARPPQTLEAKILFDADKLDVVGAVGIARTLMYKGNLTEPLYTKTPDGKISDGAGESEPSFFQEYKRKLENIYDGFYTCRGKEMALARREAAVRFYEDLLEEVRASYAGKAMLDAML